MTPRNIFLVALFALLIPAAARAQSPAPSPDVSDLDKQLQEMRAQMAQMQSKLDEMEKAKAVAEARP